MTTNNITGDKLKTKPPTDNYDSGWDKIWGKGQCMCEACKDGTIHDSDCSVHNEPAFPNGECDCSKSKGDLCK